MRIIPGICDNVYFQKLCAQDAVFLVQPKKNSNYGGMFISATPTRCVRLVAGRRMKPMPPCTRAKRRGGRRHTPRIPFGGERRFLLLFYITIGEIYRLAWHVLFANVDICPVPHFYRTIDDILSRGYGSLVSSHRIIRGWPIDPSLVDMMAADHGLTHQGCDYFVFSRP
jgi:hypothetical protein